MNRTLGKYQLLGRIAVGGMAEVFVARTAGPAGFSKTVAIKRIHPHLASDPTFVEMFIDEARVASRLTHPNIVQIIDLGEVAGEYYLAMEYLHGRTLGEVIARAGERGAGADGVLPLGVVLTVAVNVLSALGYAHTRSEAPVVHRDVSPHNILVAFDGHVKLVDFGIAKAKDRVHQTRAGVIKGKARYMPPEQLGGKSVDGRADLYALGAVLHEALTGAKLFSELADGQLFDAKRVRHVEPPSSLRSGVPAELDALVLSLLAHDRDARPASCAAAVQAIERIMLKSRTLASNERVGEVMRGLWSTEERRVPGGAAPDALRQVTTADGKRHEALLDANAFVEESTDAYLGRPPTPSVQRTREVADVPTAQLEREQAPTAISQRTAVRHDGSRGAPATAVADLSPTNEAREGPTRPRGLELFHAPTQLHARPEGAGRVIVALGVAGVVALAVAVALAIGFARPKATSEPAAAMDPKKDPGVDPRKDPGLDPRVDPAMDPARGRPVDPQKDPRRDPPRDPPKDPRLDPRSARGAAPAPTDARVDKHTTTALRAAPTAPAAARARRRRRSPRLTMARPARATARLELLCTPAAQVFAGKRALGRTPLSVTLLAGRRRLQLRSDKPRFSYPVVVELRAGATARRSVRVPRARLRVGAVPWARVLIDGRLIDDTPIKPMWLYAGRHRVELIYPSGGTKLRHVRVLSVRGGEDLRVIHDFRKR